METLADALARGESHASNTTLGPCNYQGVRYLDSNRLVNFNNTPPTANAPYSVSVVDNANYTAKGP